jgi:hypothetical protein
MFSHRGTASETQINNAKAQEYLDNLKTKMNLKLMKHVVVRVMHFLKVFLFKFNGKEKKKK